ncbi:MAG: ABC transporter substrate-binding protein [Candidatus Kuenenia sp.]|nr:ABC transporter substrate-binding protein [Candidatus Kuenenia hertensis]
MKKWFMFILFIFFVYCISYFVSHLTKEKRDVPASGNIERIVSLTVAATQILIELGLEDKIAGVNSTFSNPEEVKKKPHVGRQFGNINIEAVLSLKPDIVFASNSDAEVLKEKDVNVFVVETCNLNEVIRLVTEIGKVVAMESQASQLVQKMQKRIDDIQEKLRKVNTRPLVYFESGAIGRTRAPGSLTHDLITMAGGINLAKDEPITFPLLSIERIIEMNPDIILLEEYGVPPEEVKKRDGWQKIKAVRNNKIFISPTMYTNYTPKCINGLEQYARWFHPEAFGE